jgi:hypothetical protein
MALVGGRGRKSKQYKIKRGRLTPAYQFHVTIGNPALKLTLLLQYKQQLWDKDVQTEKILNISKCSDIICYD